MSQVATAERAGLHRTEVALIERGLRLPRLDTILKLAAGLGVSSCELLAWMWWDPARHVHFETPPSVAALTGHEALDFDLPAGFRISPVGYETDEELQARRKEGRRRPTGG